MIFSEIYIKKRLWFPTGTDIVVRTRNMLCVRTLALMDSVLFATYVEAGGTRHACLRCARSQSLIQFRKCLIIRSVIHTACGPTADTKGTYVQFLFWADSWHALKTSLLQTLKQLTWHRCFEVQNGPSSTIQYMKEKPSLSALRMS